MPVSTLLFRRPVAAAAAAGALLLTSACGGDGDATASPSPTSASPSPSQAAAVVLTTDELEARLLTVEDLPEGFEEDTGTADEGAVTSPDAECQSYLDQVDAEDLDAEAEARVSFTSEEVDFTEELGSYEGDGAERAFAAASDGLSACSTLTVEGVEGELAVEQNDIAVEGVDDVVAIRVETVLEGGGQQVAVGNDLAVVRIANNILRVSLSGSGERADADVEGLLEIAVTKFTAGAEASPTATSSPTARGTGSPTARATTSPTARATSSPTARATASPTS